jgi:hypothetical protein
MDNQAFISMRTQLTAELVAATEHVNIAAKRYTETDDPKHKEQYNIRVAQRACWQTALNMLEAEQFAMALRGGRNPIPAEPPTLVRFADLPKGTRFRYPDGADVWVVLETHGRGLIAKWGGPTANKALQLVYSATDEGDIATLMVYLAEGAVNHES